MQVTQNSGVSDVRVKRGRRLNLIPTNTACTQASSSGTFLIQPLRRKSEYQPQANSMLSEGVCHPGCLSLRFCIRGDRAENRLVHEKLRTNRENKQIPWLFAQLFDLYTKNDAYIELLHAAYSTQTCKTAHL